MTALWTPQQPPHALAPFDWSLHTPNSEPYWQDYLSHYQLPSQSEGHAHFIGLLNIPEHEVVVQAWLPMTTSDHPNPPTATALITHGLYDHIGLYHHLIRYCLSRGWQVIAFDLPGHGLSGGQRARINSFQDYDLVFTRVLSNVAVQLAKPIHVFGQSTGGAIAINYLLKNSVEPVHSPFASVNLLAPLVRPHEWRKIRAFYWLLSLFMTTLKRGRSKNSQDQQFLDFLWHNDPLQPGELGLNWLGALLEWEAYLQQRPICQVPINIVQGDQDRSVLWRYNLPFLKKKFPNHRLLILHTARHHLVNEIEPIRQQLWTFFDESLPS